MIRATPCVVALVLIFVAYPAFSQCDTYDAYVEIGASSSEYYSSVTGRCYWQGTYGYAFFSISHTIKGGESGTGPMLYFFSYETTGHEASNSTNWLGNAGDCFYTEGDFFISEEDYSPVYNDSTTSACACIPSDEPTPPDEDVLPVDDDPCAGIPNCVPPPPSPLILSFEGGFALTAASDGVVFDIDADGDLDVVAWTRAGTRQAFLVLDRNADGVINDGAELFGDHTPMPDGTRAANGFVALAALDSNGDGVLTQDDQLWHDLRLWLDLDHDGVSQPNELHPVGSGSITALGLNYHWTGRRDGHGNLFRYQGQYWLNGKPKQYYDIYLLTR